MILHIAPDEKFIDMGFRVFEEVAPEQNKLLIITNQKRVNFVKKSDFITCSTKGLRTKKIIDFISGFDAIIFHSMFDFNVQLPIHVKVLWIGWGFDYYDLIYKRESCLFLPKTLSFKNKSETYKSKFEQLIKSNYLLNGIKSKLRKQTTKKQLINNISYFAPVLTSEYSLISKNNLDFNPQLVDWNYGTLEDDLIKGFEGKVIKGANILLGNSATYPNNHLDIFDLIKDLDFRGNVICPLSYGDDRYKQEVCKQGKKYLQNKFVALTDYMNVDEYVNVISSCSVVIMNHVRQQGLGNVVIMLYLGAKVFLRSENPMYNFFAEEGAVIYNIEELENNPTLIEQPLNENDIKINRQILNKYWSQKVAHEKTLNIVSLLTS
jgi:dTDP-N-acetylfucosamine:lipid II N-acetylfucosaminyltransferase